MRISQITAINLEKLSKELKKSKKSILEKAVQNYIREQFLKKTNEEYKKLISENPELYQEEQKEMSEWDITLNDLENE